MQRITNNTQQNIEFPEESFRQFITELQMNPYGEEEGYYEWMSATRA